MIDDKFMENWGAFAMVILHNGMKVNKALRLMGIPLNEEKRVQPECQSANRKWTEKEIREIDKLKAQGLTWREIAEMYDAEKETIRNVYYYRINKIRKREYMEKLNPEKLKGCPKDCPDRCADPNCHNTCPEHLERCRKNAEINRNRRADIDYNMYKCSSVIETQRKIQSRIRLKNPK